MDKHLTFDSLKRFTFTFSMFLWVFLEDTNNANSKKKCALMQFTTTSSKLQHSYNMKGQTLETVQHHPYLGVELSDNMKFNLHINNISKKASSVLEFLKRNLKHCPQKIKERAYQSLVRPKLENVSSVWNPQQKTQIKQLEQVQRKAARFVTNPSTQISQKVLLQWWTTLTGLLSTNADCMQT